MFLPIGDDCARYRRPYVTLALIGINAAVYAHTFSMDDGQFDLFVLNYGSLGSSYSLTRSVTGGFLHADIFHLLGNMWFLFLFGSSVEGKLGHAWMACTYLICLVVSDLAQYLFSPVSYVVALGASGAVGGVIGAYWFLFSRCKVEFFYWLAWFYAGRVWLNVFWAIVWLFAWDVFWWVIGLKYGIHTGVANSAHLGGLACGLVCGAGVRRFGHVTLDGDDMYTRVVVWWIKRRARGQAGADPSAYARPREWVKPEPPPEPKIEGANEDGSLPFP